MVCVKKRSSAYYLIEAFRTLRNSGYKTLLDPVGTIQANAKKASFINDQLLIKSLDYSSVDLARNREAMERFHDTASTQAETVNWFVPYFDHAYAGIQTILRFVNYFHTKRHVKNTLVIYGNTSASEDEVRAKVARLFPNLLKEKVVVLRNYNLNTVPSADISIATFWTSAYLLLKFNRTKGKFYFIQDYEPLFYPAGTLYALAEATYRFGFYGIVNTPGLYDLYVREYKGIAEYFIPSVDDKVFYASDRTFAKPSAENPFTIFFYARLDGPRNAFELGAAALREIKRRYGEFVKIYTAGSKWNPRTYDLEGVVNDLGLLPYEKTASLYRKCDLGMIFTLTKHPSYLPFELMACGCPVITNYNAATTWFLKDGFNCLLAEPSISCICEKVEMLMNNPDLRKHLVSNALKSIPATSWNNEIEKIYKFICSPHST
jgi:glycosyltransferase involved in cell wall biosynthesis